MSQRSLMLFPHDKGACTGVGAFARCFMMPPCLVLLSGLPKLQRQRVTSSRDQGALTAATPSTSVGPVSGTRAGWEAIGDRSNCDTCTALSAGLPSLDACHLRYTRPQHFTISLTLHTASAFFCTHGQAAPECVHAEDARPWAHTRPHTRR